MALNFINNKSSKMYFRLMLSEVKIWHTVGCISEKKHDT